MGKFTTEEMLEMLELFEFIDAIVDMPVQTPAEPVVFDGVRNGMRTTEELSRLYDVMVAEVNAEHISAKAKTDMRRDAKRKHNLSPRARKQCRDDHKWKRYSSTPGYTGMCSLAEFKAIGRNRSEWADWEIYETNVADEKKIQAAYAAISAEYYAEMNEWLKYA